MKKILFIIGRLSPIGGEERSLSLLCNELALRGAFDVTIACLEGGRAVFPLDERISVVYLTDIAAGKLARVRHLLKLSCGGGYDLIVGYGKTARLPSAIAGRCAVPPLVFCERIHPFFENDTLKRKLFIFLGMRLLRGQHGAFQSHAVTGFYKGLKKFKVIPNMLDVSELPDVRSFSGRENKLISAGRLNAQKNFALLIRAFAASVTNVTRGQSPCHTLDIYGDGEQREELESLIFELNAQEFIRLRPASSEIFEIMNSAKYYVCSSNAEGYPNSLLEAMAMGMACISTDCSGAVGELIEDGVNGLIVPVGDEEAMSQAIDRLISNDELAGNMAKRAVAVRRKNDKDVLISEWISFFEGVV